MGDWGVEILWDGRGLRGEKLEKKKKGTKRRNKYIQVP